MAWARFRNKLAFLFQRSRYERELAEEIETHQRMWQEEAEQIGLGKESAAMSARKAMGNPTLMSEESRSEWMVGWLEAFGQDIRYCLRGFARHPGFTGVALLTLALGIGANTAIFRLVDAILLRSLPVQNPGELVAIGGRFPYPRFEQIRDRQQVLTGVFASHTLRDTQLSTEGRTLGLATCELVSGNYFSIVGVNPVAGRPIIPDDDRVPESSPVAVISHGFWKRAFAMSPDAIGRKLQVQPGGFASGAGTSGFEQEDKAKRNRGEAVLTIVGVAPPEFFGETVGTSVDVWVPMMMQPAMMPGRAWLTRRSASWVSLMGRRRPGTSEESARASLNGLFRQVLADEIGSKLTEQQQRNIANARLNVETAAKGFANLRREFSQPLLVLMTVVGLVLLIACLNIANLLLARATARRQEMAMRLSLGASRGRLLRQLFTESLVLAGAGGAAGVLFAFIGTRILVTMVSNQSRPILLPFEADWRILGFTAGLSLLSGILFGLAPAVRGTSGLHGSLKDTARTAAGGRNRTAKALVAVQVAVSLILLVGAGLFLRTLYNLKTQNVGYDRENLLLMRLDPIGAGYRGDDIGRACVQLMQRIAAIPGVRAVTFSENGLFSGTESGTPIEAEGFVPATREDRMARFDQIGPGYFTHVGIPLMLGRDIAERDQPGAPRVAVINDTMARFYFKNASPIGKRISVRGPSNVDLEVVGVARDSQDHSFRWNPVRRFYVSYMQPIDGLTTVNYEIRTSSSPAAVASLVREAVQNFNRSLPVISLKTVTTLMDDSIATERLVAKLSVLFGVLAAILAAIGLYGVMSYTIARRTNEIGIRVALGAQRWQVVLMVLREITILIVCGAIVGAASASGLTKYVATLIFGLKPNDPLTFVGASLLLMLVGIVAGYLPARRAAGLDPVVALRHE